MRSIPGQGNALETEPSFDDAAGWPFESFYRTNRTEKQPDCQYQCAYLPVLGICCTFDIKIHHYVRFFVHGFRFLRERVYLRCTKIVRLKCWRGFNMLCSSCFLSWQEVWTALRFSPVGRFRSPTRFASPVSGRRFRHTIVSRRQSSPATLRSKIPSNPPPRRRSSACAMIPGPWRRPAGCRAVRLIRAASTCIPSRSIIMSFRWGVS